MREAHKEVMGTLLGAGRQAYLVGGCVRDAVLGRAPKDHDVATDAVPDEVRALFPKTVPVGAKFGVVVVVAGGEQVEVATFRADGAYTDGRRPDSVEYSRSAGDDVSRRDFTMNGLLMDAAGGLVDHVGGLADIEARVIRCIGDPDARFGEDALRMLRAVRFAAQLGFDIEPGTMAAIQRRAPDIRRVSRERVAAELFKIVAAPEPLRGLVPMVASGLGAGVFPREFLGAWAFADAVRRFTEFKAEHDPMLGMAMLLADAPPGAAGRLVGCLRLSAADTAELLGCANLAVPHGPEASPAEKKRFMRRPGSRLALEIFVQDEVIGKTSNGLESTMAAVLECGSFTPEELRPPPLVTGDDLIGMGLEPGAAFRDILLQVEEGQLNGTLDREEALRRIRGHLVSSVTVPGGATSTTYAGGPL